MPLHLSPVIAKERGVGLAFWLVLGEIEVEMLSGSAHYLSNNPTYARDRQPRRVRNSGHAVLARIDRIAYAGIAALVSQRSARNATGVWIGMLESGARLRRSSSPVTIASALAA